jgi:hypothetical protein
MVVSQESSRLGHIRASLMSEEGILIAFFIDGQTPELIDVEGLAAFSDALLLEDGRSTVFQFHCQIADKQERGEDDQADGGYQ